ncbi:RICIN domain-containing protein [Actinomycetospora lemnae]|uniref:RICIN domain-containing protein n=1 Tax=Actinomycetospora lemnae TaxID=3019891 RepID=A0ABT5T103_9PSEU|nr:RICIN domain-containing protein [Actinomycetospora sp. DW7H6]MDD7968798.1 RICIN domain-containing protein [Actinomycetospora sp. DW7H6]
MVTSRAITVRRRASRWFAVLGVLVAAALVFSTVAVAPQAEAATVLGQFRNGSGKCLENLNNATTTNNTIRINACGPTTTQAQQFSRWANDEAIKTPAGRCLGTLNNGTAAGTNVVLVACNPANNTQHWVIRTDGLVVNRQAVRCLAPLNNSTANGTRTVLANCTTAAAMRWTVPAASTPTTTPTTTTTPVPPTTTTTTTVPPTTTTVPPTTTTTTPPPAGRDPLRQPFSSTSIWNMPIGSGAVYVPADLPALPGGSTGARVPQVDDEPLILTPTAPLTDILFSSGGWGGDRCQNDPTRVLARAPIPSGYVLPSDNKNQSAAILAADGRTIISPQPLARCRAGGPATSYVRYPDQDIYGPGIEGSHGGSGMSALGGSIRIGELRPGQQGPRHALKVNLYARGELGVCGPTRAECFRWPAVKSDSRAVTWYGQATNNQNRAMRMGALLALPASTSIASLNLQTEPARQIAWTLQNYGAYVVDDTSGPSFALNAENGPGGNMRTQFRGDWGYDFEIYASNANAWSRDLQKLRTALAVVDNNGPTSIGGGGTPRQPLLPELVQPLVTVPPTVPTAPQTTATSGPVPPTTTGPVPGS